MRVKAEDVDEVELRKDVHEAMDRQRRVRTVAAQDRFGRHRAWGLGTMGELGVLAHHGIDEVLQVVEVVALRVHVELYLQLARAAAESARIADEHQHLRFASTSARVCVRVRRWPRDGVGSRWQRWVA